MYPGIAIKRSTFGSISQNKLQWGTGIALLIHSVGLLGMILFDRTWFARMTPLNLLVMFILIIWTQPQKKASFFSFVFIAFLCGMTSEVIGVKTGILFGNYVYGSILGLQLAEVPLIIGLNWFVVLYSSLATVHYLVNHFSINFGRSGKDQESSNISIKLIIGAAILAVIFDWVMEPVAVKLGFWTWLGNGQIPLFNYFSWLFISTLILFSFRLLNLKPDNIFAVYLFLIQFLFFIMLRVFL